MALVLIAVLVPSVCAGFVAWRFLKSNMEKAIHRELEATAISRGERAVEWLSQRRAEMSAINREQSLLQAEREGLLSGSAMSIEIIRENLRLQKENYDGFTAFALIDQNHAVIAQAPASYIASPFPPLQTPIPAADKGELHRVSGWHNLVIAERVIEAPGRSGSGPKSITLLGFIDPESLERHLADDNTHNLKSYLVTADGKGASPSAKGISADQVRRLIGESLPANDIRPYTGAGRMDALGIAFKLREFPVILVSESAREEIQAALSGLRQSMVTVILVITVLMLVPSLLLARSIILPLEDLSRTAKLIREGRLGLAATTKAGGELGRLTANFNDMSNVLKTIMDELTLANARLNILSTTDHLTEIRNRRFLMDHLQEEIKRSTRTGEPLSVIMLDIDHFKSFNDRYGHKGGDAALREVARRIVTAVRETDMVGRFGGEEFLMILPDTDKAGAIAVAEKVRVEISSRPLELEGENATGLTVSLGVGTLPEDADTVDRLVDSADRQLYRAKNFGRNQVGNLVRSVTERMDTPDDPSAAFTSGSASGSGSISPKSAKNRTPRRPSSPS